MNVKLEYKNKEKMFEDSAEKTPHYGLRKLSAGVASVLLSTTLWMGKSADAHAATETANTKNAVNDNESDSTVTTDSGLVVDSAASSATAQNSQSEQKEDNDSVDTDTLSASEKSTQNSVSKAADDAAKQSNVSENSKETDSSSDANNASDTENSNSEVSSNTDKTAASSDSETAENSKMDDTKADSAVNKSDNNSAITESTSKANAEKESTTDSTSDTSAVSLSKDNDTGATSVTIVKNSSSSTTNTVSIKKLTATTLASLSSNSATFNPRMMFTSLAAVTSSNIHGTHAQRSSDDVPYFYDKYNDTDGNATLQGTFTPTSSTTGSYEGYYHATYLNYVNLVLKITFNYAYNESNNTMSVTNMTLGYSKDPTVQGVGFNDAMAILTGNAGLPTAYAAAFPFEQGDLDGVTPESLTNAIYSSAGADQVLGLFVQNNKTDDSSWKTQIHDYTVTPDANGNFKLFQLAGRWYGNADYYGYDGSVWDYIQVNSGSVKADTIKETVKYVVSDGKVAAPSDNVQTVRIIKIGENGKTDTKTFNAVNTPAIAGYTADISVVPSKNVNYGDSDIVVTVTYTPDAQKATVTYIDDNTGSTITSKSLTGVSNAGTGYTTAATIASLQAQGYILVSDSTNGVEVVFDNNDAVDQSYVVHLKHGTNAGSLQRTVNRTITYKMTDGSAAPAQVKDRLVFNGKEVIDNVTKAVIGITWDNAKNFNDISSPVIQGYTADRKLVSNKGISHDSPDINEVVTYSPDAQKATVSYIDDNTGKTITSKDLTGSSNAKSGYTTGSTIASLQAQGYVLVSDSTNGAEIVFDNNTSVDQAYVVHLKHGTSQRAVSNTVNRTINYKATDGATVPMPVKKDSLTFNGIETIDNVTGKVTGTVWDGNKDFADVATPAMAGYTASQNLVSNKGISHNSNDIVENIVYTPDSQKANVTYIDDTTGSTISSKDLMGPTNSKSGYTTASTIASLQAQGYVLVSDSTNGAEIVFDNNDSVDQNYVVHLKHGTHNNTISDTVNRTITYKMKDGSTAPAQVKDSLAFNGTQTIDNVTKVVINTVWDANKDFADKTSPAVKGYTSDRSVVSNKNIPHDSADITEVVTYSPDPQKATVTYIDQTTGKQLKLDSLNGVTNAHSGYTTGGKIAQYTASGYALVSDSTNGAEIIYDNDDAVDQAYTVILKHTYMPVTPTTPGIPGTPMPGTTTPYPPETDKGSLEDTVNRTITYKMTDGSTAPAQVKDSLYYSATKIIDKVTGEITSVTWTPNQDFKSVASPNVKGYTPDRVIVTNTNINHASADITENVTYNPDPQKAKVTYIDQTTGKQLTIDTLQGVTNAKSGYTTANKIKQYEANGYALVSDSTNGTEIIYDNDDSVDQAYEVILKHTYLPVDPTKPGTPGTPMPGTTTPYPPETDKGSLEHTVNRTITYVMKDGSTAPAQVKDSLYYSAVKTIDKVTGEITSVIWTPNQDFKDITSPAVKGYTPDRSLVSNKNIGHTSADITEMVTYAPDAQKATVTYIDQTTGKQLTLDTLEGVTNAHSGYTTESKIKQYEAGGYALVSDSTNGAEIIYDNDDAVNQAYTVILKHTYTTVDPINPGTPGTPMPGTTTVYPPETDRDNLQRTVFRQIDYQMADGKHLEPDSVSDSLYFSATKTIDKVTGEITNTTWTPAQDFKDVESPAIKGYTPDKKLISNKGITHLSYNIHEVVTYNPDKQRATVEYIDQTTGKQLAFDQLVGVTNGESDYSTESKINSFKRSGYALVSDSTGGYGIIFDDDDDVDQAYTVILKHTYITVDPKNPGTPGSSMPGTTTVYPEGSDKASLEHTVNRTITYKMADGSTAPAQVKDSLYYSAAKTIDKVTGEVVKTVWTPAQDFKDITSPAVKGYTPDRASVSNKGITHDMADITESVTYTPDKQKATVTYIDQTTGKQLTIDSLIGVTNAKSGYTTAGKIKQYVASGYALVSDSTNGKEIIYDNDDAVDQAYTVILKHTYTTVDPKNPGTPGQTIPGTDAKYPDGTDKASLENTVNRTITYVMKDGSKAPSQVKDSLYYAATKTIDKVTGLVTETVWTPAQDFKDIATPAVKGYTPDRTSVSNKGIAHDHADIAETVNYTPDKQSAKIIYIDQTTGEQLRLDTINGVTNAHSGYTTKDKIQEYLNNGYELVSDTTNGSEIVYDNDDAVDQSFTVTLKHTYQTVTEDNPAKPGYPINQNANGVRYPEGTDKASLGHDVTRTIIYKMADGTKAPEQVKETLHYSAVKVIDKVTGKIVSEKWTDNQDFKDVTSPDVSGYTVDRKVVSNKNIAHTSDDIVETVTYSPDWQKATVTYLDETTGKTLKTDDLNGLANAKSGYSTKDTIQGYLDNGYELVSDSTNGLEIVYDADDAKDQAYTVVLKHKFTTVDEDHPAVPGTAINKNADGAKYPEGTDKASLGHDVKRDITYCMSDGSKAPSPIESVLHFTAKKVIDNVTGEVVSTDWSSAQDFDDVTSPSIAGYTADQKVVSNKGITHDHSDIHVVVTYVANAQKATVTYIDATTGKTITVKELSGKSNGKSGYTTAGEIEILKGKGYALVSDDTNGQEIVFDSNDALEQTYVVKMAHLIKDSTETHEATRTINLHEPNGIKSIKQAAKIVRTVKTDAVTGDKTYGDWSEDSWKLFNAPKVKGYKASLDKVLEKLVTDSTKDETVDIYYKQNPEAKKQEKKAETPKEAEEKQPEQNVQAATTQSAETPKLPATGNAKDSAILAVGTFATGASLLATVLKHRLRKNK